MKKFKYLPEIIIGGGLFCFGILLWIISINGKTINNYFGVCGFIFGGASTFIFGTLKNHMESKKKVNSFERIIKQWCEETDEKTRNIRQNQRIEFVISSYTHKNDVEYILIKCQHKYTYEYGSYNGEYISIDTLVDTFNDISISRKENTSLPGEKEHSLQKLLHKKTMKNLNTITETTHTMLAFLARMNMVVLRLSWIQKKYI